MALFEASILLSDTKVVKSRKVYNLITLISEVSGVADILFVSMTVLIKWLYTPLMLEAALLKHIVKISTPSKKEKEFDKSVKINSLQVVTIIKEIKNRFRLRLTVSLMILSKLVPSKWRLPRTNRLIEIADKHTKRI
jgi:acyl carrier protein